MQRTAPSFPRTAPSLERDGSRLSDDRCNDEASRSYDEADASLPAAHRGKLEQDVLLRGAHRSIEAAVPGTLEAVRAKLGAARGSLRPRASRNVDVVVNGDVNGDGDGDERPTIADFFPEKFLKRHFRERGHDFGPVKSAHHPLALTEDNMTIIELLPANDNAGPRTRVTSPATFEEAARLLALAGYDPDYIPVAKRLIALQVVWCLEKGGFSDGEIARFVGAKRVYVKGIRRHLEKAARGREAGVMGAALRAAGISPNRVGGGVCFPQHEV